MPVPIATTHPQRAIGLQCHTNAELPTQGPFTRLFSNDDTIIEQKINAPSQKTHVQSNKIDQSFAHTNDVQPSLATNNLTFYYCDIDGRPFANKPPVVKNMTLSIPRGSTVLLTGPNGAGKTTLLKVLGGKHMVPESAVQVLGQPPFHATNLTTSGDLSYIGGNWTVDVAFAGYSIPLAVCSIDFYHE